MRNIALFLTYEGTAYHGWQMQKNLPTVQQTLEKAIAMIVGHSVHVTGCGRTDAGVHARCYVANFRTTSTIPVDRLPYALNTHLPVDVVVTTQEGLPDRELLEELTAYVQRRREIAVEVQVRAPQTTTVNLTVRVAPKPGYAFTEVADRVAETVRGWFTGALLGRKVLRAELGDLIYHCDGVDNYVIAQPTADVTVETDVLPVLGTLKVEELT